MPDLPVHRRDRGFLPRLSEWDPFLKMQELMEPLEEFSKFFTTRLPGRFSPAFEVKETQDAFIFKADVPGLEEKDLDISVTGDRIYINGKREVEASEDTDHFYAYERSYGSFTRSFTLPEGVDPDAIDASLKKGVLTLHLPKRAEVKSRHVEVKGELPGKGGQAQA